MNLLEKARAASQARWGTLLDEMAESAECSELVRVLNEYGYHLKAAGKVLELTSPQLIERIEHHKLKPRWEQKREDRKQ